ncbi:hypothetical protein ES332_D11G371200v1 [Gossypium tomentosum]|uniref:CN hydrolase domain-containing protein n=1 Tax=Gossypium tomentosum TaxID=34277 RepID=A0A5D2IW42_GOSTO|nr:hypothetical protein ES332_D11G371200v1 [Gossypium tomentosum]
MELGKKMEARKKSKVSKMDQFEVSRLLLGLNCGTTLETIVPPESAKALSSKHEFDLQAFKFSADKELTPLLSQPLLPFQTRKKAIFEKLGPIIDAAGTSGVNIICLQEAWMMPFAFCTREKRWCEFAEPVNGESTQFLQESALKYNMVIISSMVERNINHGETLWNTAVIIGNHGNIIGKHRKKHIPRGGDFNESTY